ncbi:MAG: hypothetical protein QM710_08880 [Flavobacterium sp.]
MRKLLLIIVILCGFHKGHAQFYYEGEIGGIVSSYTDGEKKEHQVTVGGINFRGGIGVHDEDDIVFLGLYSGMDGNWRHQMGILPVYLNARVGLPLSETSRIYFGFGYGKSYQIGSENLHGFLRKYTISFSGKEEDGNRAGIFLEINNHGFNFIDDHNRVITLNIGFTFTFL